MEGQKTEQCATGNEQLRRGVCHSDRKGWGIMSWENASLDFMEFNKHKENNVPNNFQSHIFIKNRLTWKNAEYEQGFSSVCAAQFQKTHTREFWQTLDNHLQSRTLNLSYSLNCYMKGNLCSLQNTWQAQERRCEIKRISMAPTLISC